jgi:hypothetical protein
VQHRLLPLHSVQEEKKGEAKDEAEEMRATLQSLKFGTAALASEPSYALRSHLQSGGSGSKGRECISRSRKEWATLCSGSVIPDDVCIRIDYFNGAFLFDVFIPDSYPQTPPKVHFLTTGSGSWRAGPNLYNPGQVSCSQRAARATSCAGNRDSRQLMTAVSPLSSLSVLRRSACVYLVPGPARPGTQCRARCCRCW